MLEKIKTRLSIQDDLQDAVIDDLIDTTKSEYRLLAGAAIVPDDLEWIIKEIVIVRYNRLGNEGQKKSSVEGLSATYDQADDWSKYYKYLGLTAERRGNVRFI